MPRSAVTTAPAATRPVGTADDPVAELDRQLATLIDLGLPAAAGVTAATCADRTSPLRDHAASLAGSTFVLVLPGLLAADRLVALSRMGDRAGFTTMERRRPRVGSDRRRTSSCRPGRPTCWSTSRPATTASTSRRRRCCPRMLAAGRTPLTLDEGLALLLQDGGVLRRETCFSMLGVPLRRPPGARALGQRRTGPASAGAGTARRTPGSARRRRPPASASRPTRSCSAPASAAPGRPARPACAAGVPGRGSSASARPSASRPSQYCRMPCDHDHSTHWSGVVEPRDRARPRPRTPPAQPDADSRSCSRSADAERSRCPPRSASGLVAAGSREGKTSVQPLPSLVVAVGEGAHREPAALDGGGSPGPQAGGRDRAGRTRRATTGPRRSRAGAGSVAARRRRRQ